MSESPRRVIANALVLFGDGKTAPNLAQAPLSEGQKVYLKNSFCSLKTAGLTNPGVDRVLLHDGDLGPVFSELFIQAGVKLVPLPYTAFRVPDHLPWRAGYYKLGALKWLADHYDQVLLIDTDTVVLGVLDDLWRDAVDQVLLMDTGHRFGHPARQDILALGEHLKGSPVDCTHFGGEFVAGPAPSVREFLAECSRWFEAMSRDWEWFKNHKDQGDESILSLAAGANPGLVRSAAPYVSRYWTNDGFRLLSTNWKFNPVDVWHLPLEKSDGLLKLFDRLSRCDTMPDRHQLARMVHLEYTMPKQLLLMAKQMKRNLLRLFGAP